MVMRMSEPILVAGAGLAGCEAAWAIAESGLPVRLLEMKPGSSTPAHHSPVFAELVCSNSLKAARPDSAAGLLKEEMRRLGSLCMEAAAVSAVPAGGALAVDRDRFSAYVTDRIRAHPLIGVEESRLDDLPSSLPAVVATGPLTAEPLASALRELCGGALSFFDAAAPIVTAESVDMTRAFRASRYDREESGAGDYINCPLNKEEYEAFHAALVTAETAPQHAFDRQGRVYEGCMPIEVLASRGLDAIRFGPMKPVGLRDPRTGHRPWAVLQLRMENADGSLLNLVGFQTNLKFGEQKRVFGMIPALHSAEFARYGVMHRNTFLDSPRLLDGGFSVPPPPRALFCRADDRGGGIYGVGGLRYSGGEKRRAFSEGTAPSPPTARYHDRGAGCPYQRVALGGFPAHGSQLRRAAAPRRADAGQAEALRGPGGTGPVVSGEGPARVLSLL